MGLLRRRDSAEPSAELEVSGASPSSAEGVWLVVGLGNPGPQYVGNRHNVGFMVAEVLAERAGARFKRHKAGAEVLEGRLAGQRVVLAKPQSYMNLSGGPTKALASFYKVPVEQVVCVYDEIDIGFGQLRLKRGGGAGGHNGVRSLDGAMGKDYLRVRVGVGRPPGRQAAADYVLKDFTKTEQKEIDLVVDRAADAVEALLTGTLEAAQNTFHTDPV